MQLENKLITLEQASNAWLSQKQLFTKPSTYAKYTHILRRHILPRLGSQCIEELDTGSVSSFLKLLLQEGRIDGSGGLSSKTVHDIYMVLRSIIRFSEECLHTAARITRTPGIWRRNPKVSVLDAPFRIVLENFLLSQKQNPCCLGILLCLYTGIRLGEICALKWENIHLKGGFIRIVSTLQRIQNVENADGPKTRIICSPPKSLASSREIPLPEFLLEILRQGCPKYDLNSFFLTGSSHFLEPRSYQNHFKAYLKINEIPEINFHALRHTFATRCVLAGVDIKSLSEILGHSSVQMTLNYYVHPSLEDKRRQIALLERAL